MAAEEVLPIANITPHTLQPWKSRVMIVEKGFPRDPKSSTTKFQRLILVDSHGTQAQATIFGRDIDLLKNTLVVFRHYFISNANIRPIEQRHRIVPHPYQWIINSKAIVEEAPVDDLFMLPIVHHFIPFSQMEQYKDSPTLIDVIGVAIQANPVRFQQTRNGSVRIREILLIDTELNSILLTMWNQFIDNEAVLISDQIVTRPVVVGLRVKAVAFNGVSISSRVTSSFLVNPNFNMAAELRARISANADVVDTILARYNNDLRLNPPEAKIKKEEVEIASLENLPDNVTYIVKGSITVRTERNPLWYMACSGCYHAINATYLQPFTCHHQCPAEKPHGIPRCRVNVLFSDKSGEVLGTMFGPAAERVLGFTAKELMIFAKDNGPDADLMAIINKDPIPNQIMQVKPTTFKDLNGEMKRRFTFSFPPDIASSSNENVGSSSQNQFVEDETAKDDANNLPRQNIPLHSEGTGSINSVIEKNQDDGEEGEEIVWRGDSVLVGSPKTLFVPSTSSTVSKFDKGIEECTSTAEEVTSESVEETEAKKDQPNKGKRVRVEDSPLQEP